MLYSDALVEIRCLCFTSVVRNVQKSSQLTFRGESEARMVPGPFVLWLLCPFGALTSDSLSVD